jgi:hypothetical protein
MIPVYGFMQGDTLGLLILLQEDQTIQQVADTIQASAGLRAAPWTEPQVLYHGRALDLRLTVQAAGIVPLERLDVRHGAPPAGAGGQHEL